MTPSSEEVGEKFAAALGDGPSRATLAAQRVRIMEMAQRSFRPRARPNFRALALAVIPLAALAALVVFVVTREPAFEATWRGTSIAPRTPIEAREAASGTLDFSDGSQVTLEPHAVATLSELTREHATLRVDRGRVSANIRKHPDRHWMVNAGPYAVHVVGTRFNVSWDPGESALRVLVLEGRVRVTGGDLPTTGVVLEAGGELSRRTPMPRPVPANEAVETATGSLDGAKVAKGADTPPAPSGAVAISTLAAKGKYKEALALAEKQGFEKLTLELPENDLLVLANAARYSGDATRARQALLKLRQRFAGRPAADLAALYLAKIAEDMTREPREAVRWLRTFLQGSPSGDLAAGARASLMSLLLRSGDKVAARAVAEDYLRYHASGPHADEARALVRE
jgi:hypothetical protein